MLLLTLMKYVHTFEINSSSSYRRYYGTRTWLYTLSYLSITYSREFPQVAHKIEQLLTTKRSCWWSSTYQNSSFPSCSFASLTARICTLWRNQLKTPHRYTSPKPLYVCLLSLSPYTVMLFPQHTFHSHVSMFNSYQLKILKQLIPKA